MDTFYLLRLFLLVLLLGGGSSRATAQIWQWANAPGTGAGNAITADSANLVYVAGDYQGRVAFGQSVLFGVGPSEAFVAILLGSGPYQGGISLAQSTVTTNMHCTGVALDGQGGGYLTGWFTDTAMIGLDTLVSAGGSDGFVMRVSSSGAPLWLHGFGGPGDDGGTGLVADRQGLVRVCGYFSDSSTFGPVVLQSAGLTDAVVAKLDDAGTLQWIHRLGGPGDDAATAVAVDRRGATLLTGYFADSATAPGPTLVSAGQVDGFLARITPAGAWGWAYPLGGPGMDRIRAVTLDAQGAAYVTGQFAGTADFRGSAATSAGGSDGFVARIDTMGTGQWVVPFGGPADDAGTALAFDYLGNVSAVGHFAQTAAVGTSTLVSAGADDILVAQFTRTGTLRWAGRAGGAGVDHPRGLTSFSGALIMTGTFDGTTATFGRFTVSNLLPGEPSIFVARVNRPVGLPDEQLATDFELVPNPARHVVQVQGLAPGAPAVEVLDPLGRVVRHVRPAAEDIQLDLRGLSPGLYLVRCGAATRRLVVE